MKNAFLLGFFSGAMLTGGLQAAVKHCDFVTAAVDFV